MQAADFTHATCTVEGSLSRLHTCSPVYDATTKTVTFVHVGFFERKEIVTCRVAAEVRDDAENGMAADYVWAFEIAPRKVKPTILSMTVKDATSGSDTHTNDQDVVVEITSDGEPEEMLIG